MWSSRSRIQRIVKLRSRAIRSRAAHRTSVLERRRSQSAAWALVSLWHSIPLFLIPRRVPGLLNRSRRFASVRWASIRAWRQNIYLPMNHRGRSRGRAAVAAVLVRTRAATLSPVVLLCSETAHEKPHSFRRRVRCRLGRPTHCFSAIVHIRSRRRVVSPAPPERFSDRRQRRGIDPSHRIQAGSASLGAVAHRTHNGDRTRPPLGSRCVASK